MSFNTTILYANKPSLTFDMPYYLSHHWPLVTDKWGPNGLQDWKVVQFSTDDGPEQAPYKVAAIITWKDKESFETLQTTEPWKIVMDDVKNFCNEMPMMMTGDVVGSG